MSDESKKKRTSFCGADEGAAPWFEMKDYEKIRINLFR